MGEDRNCSKCGYYRGTPNSSGEFVCSSCESGYDNSDEIAESKFFYGGCN